MRGNFHLFQYHAVVHSSHDALIEIQHNPFSAVIEDELPCEPVRVFLRIGLVDSDVAGYFAAVGIFPWKVVLEEVPQVLGEYAHGVYRPRVFTGLLTGVNTGAYLWPTLSMMNSR